MNRQLLFPWMNCLLQTQPWLLRRYNSLFTVFCFSSCLLYCWWGFVRWLVFFFGFTFIFLFQGGNTISQVMLKTWNQTHMKKKIYSHSLIHCIVNTRLMSFKQMRFDYFLYPTFFLCTIVIRSMNWKFVPKKENWKFIPLANLKTANPRTQTRTPYQTEPQIR